MIARHKTAVEVHALRAHGCQCNVTAGALENFIAVNINTVVSAGILAVKGYVTRHRDAASARHVNSRFTRTACTTNRQSTA